MASQEHYLFHFNIKRHPRMKGPVFLSVNSFLLSNGGPPNWYYPDIELGQHELKSHTTQEPHPVR